MTQQSEMEREKKLIEELVKEYGTLSYLFFKVNGEVVEEKLSIRALGVQLSAWFSFMHKLMISTIVYSEIDKEDLFFSDMNDTFNDMIMNAKKDLKTVKREISNQIRKSNGH